ncbi:MAG: hexose kinase [Actinobacteria bacterium]|nr:hexose kinase [Actinomycetota bacterium]
MIYTLTLNPALDIVLETYLIKKKEINTTALKSISIGGKGFNTSRALNCLGLDNIALCFYGGTFKGYAEKIIKEEKLKFKIINIVNETRINLKIIETKNNKVVEFNERGPSIRKKEISLLINFIEKIQEEVYFFIVSGSLPKNISETIYRKIILILKKKNIKVLLDSSGLPLYHGICARPYFLKINLKELLEINEIKNSKNFEKTVFEIIANYHKSGINTVMITDGAKKAYYYNGYDFLIAEPPVVNHLYVTGSGDTINAALVYSFINNFNAEKTFRFSMACGISNLYSSIPGKINLMNVREVEKKIQIKKWHI